MTATAPPRLLSPSGLPLDLDPEIDAPLVGPSVLALVSPNPSTHACNMWRVWSPFRRLQLHGYPAEWGFNSDARTVRYLSRFQAVLLCRVSWGRAQWPGARRWFDLSHKAGRRVLYECDDDLFSPFIVQQQAQGISRGMPLEELEAHRVEAVWALQQCDGVQVSTQRLATVVRGFTDAPVAVVPNAIDADWFRAAQQGATRPVEGLTIGWAGGNRPDGDLAPMAEAWGRIAKRYRDVTFLLYGHQPAIVSRYVPEPRIKRLAWRPVAKYPAGLVGVDIACCPLEERHFNRCKTPIKAMEAGLSGSAVVASPTVYREIIDGKNGLLASDADDWEWSLEALIEHENYRRRLAAQLERDVLAKWSLDKNYRRWPDAWRRLMDGT